MSDLEQVKAMSDAELDRAIFAEVMGRTELPLVWESPSKSLNAVAEVEARFADEMRLQIAYTDAMHAALSVAMKLDSRFDELTAPARQRAEACLIAWRRMKEASDA